MFFVSERMEEIDKKKDGSEENILDKTDEGKLKGAEDELEWSENSEGDNLEETEDVSRENAISPYKIDGEMEEDIKRKQNNQIKWAVFLMVGLIAIIVLVPYIKLNYLDRFEHKGLEFQKTKLGDLVFYSTEFPVVSGTGQITGSYSVNLRNDPRELEHIPVNISGDKIEFSVFKEKYGDVYISLYPFMDMCEDSGIALLTLAGFLRDSGLEISSGVTDKAYARDHNQTHKWCTPFETVIVVADRGIYTEENETSITEIGTNCYELKFKDCEVMQVTEKFMLIILEEYAERFSQD